jgi:hypothetical protein
LNLICRNLLLLSEDEGKFWEVLKVECSSEFRIDGKKLGRKRKTLVGGGVESRISKEGEKEGREDRGVIQSGQRKQKYSKKKHSDNPQPSQFQVNLRPNLRFTLP